MPKKINHISPDPSNSFTELVEETLDSVELTRNAKGDYQWSIKLYGDTIQPDGNVMIKLERIDRQLRESFGPREG